LAPPTVITLHDELRIDRLLQQIPETCAFVKVGRGHFDLAHVIGQERGCLTPAELARTMLPVHGISCAKAHGRVIVVPDLTNGITLNRINSIDMELILWRKP
jgi:hypothetical protein